MKLSRTFCRATLVMGLLLPGGRSEATDAATTGQPAPAKTSTHEPPAGSPADPDLPQPFDANAATQLLKQSPFTRAVNLAETLRLTGVAFIDGKPVATVRDTATNQTYVVSDKPNVQGWKLESATPGSQPNRAEARIMIGSELVTVRYSESQIAPAKKGSSSKGGYMPSKVPTPEEFTGHDDKGAYVRGMVYLSDEDRAKMRDVPRETREKFLEMVHDHRDTLFKSSHEERASFVKQAFDTVMRK